MDSGNIPEEAPAAVDDLILHYAYDTVKEHQSAADQYNGMRRTAGELKEFLTAYIQDGSNDSHELQQLRIFYDQAADFDALKEAGLSELQPFLDMAAGAQSIEELNAVLTSEDFPFNPWTILVVGAMAQDRDDNNGIYIHPNLLFAGLQAEEMLVDSDDPVVQTIRQAMLMQNVMAVTDLLTAMGIPSDETSKLGNEMLALEKSYGSLCNTNDERLQEYGAYADSVDLYTLDELGEKYQNFPITGILAKYGKDKAQIYPVQFADWIAALDGLWTEENLELLKCMTQVKILMECKNLIDPDIFQVSRAALKQPDPEPQDQAYAACDKSMTFAQLLAKTYVEECLGQETVDRLTVMAQSLIDTYKDLIDTTSWMGEESQQKIQDKLSNIRLNILYPDGGYFSFDDLEQVFEEASLIFTQVGPPGTSATFAVVDNHPLGNLRVNVNAQMFDGFYDTYGAQEGDGMYLAPEDRIRVWGE